MRELFASIPFDHSVVCVIWNKATTIRFACARSSCCGLISAILDCIATSLFFKLSFFWMSVGKRRRRGGYIVTRV